MCIEAGKLFNADPVTKKVTILLDSGVKLVLDNQKQLYLSRGTGLLVVKDGRIRERF